MSLDISGQFIDTLLPIELPGSETVFVAYDLIHLRVCFGQALYSCNLHVHVHLNLRIGYMNITVNVTCIAFCNYKLKSMRVLDTYMHVHVYHFFFTTTHACTMCSLLTFV